MTNFITEKQLRDMFGLSDHSEVYLPHGSELTPSARQLLSERKIKIRYRDNKGQIFTDEDDKKHHPLKIKGSKPANICSCCKKDVEKKPTYLTHLNDNLLVLKNHPRIRLRGKIDSCISYCALIQAEINTHDLIGRLLSGIRSYMGQILYSEVTEEILKDVSFDGISSDDIHKFSHNPLKYLGHDHIVIDFSYGETVTKINYLRSLVREVEVLAFDVFLNNEHQLQREDIIHGLNRLSSAVYVTMIIAYQIEQGETDEISRFIPQFKG